MLKEQNKVLRRVLLFSDLCIVALSFFIGYFLRGGIYRISPLSFYIGYLPILLLIWGGLLNYFGMYKTTGLRRIHEVLLITFKTTVFGFILFGSYIFIFHLQESISRLFMGFTFASAAILIAIEKVMLLYGYRYLIKKDESLKSGLIIFRKILIIGTGKRARHFMDLINKNPDWCIRVVGLVDIDLAKKGEIINGHKVIGAFDELPEIIHKNIIDEVVFIVPRSWLNKIEEMMHFCEDEGLKVHLAVDLFELKISKARQTDLHGFPLLTFESTPSKLWHLFIKRVFDIAFSGIALILLIPIFGIIAIMVKTTSRGPVFFKQERRSLYGRIFTLYKFRTMVVEAEFKLKDLSMYNEMQGPVFKMSNDPRVTTVGKWLRLFSIDELPQLWNVFEGDMSLVGPRPPLPAEVENYDSWQRRKLSMRPGMTCLWQIRGRNKITDFNEWMRLDLEYIDNWSLWLDVKILLKTIPVVLFATGAK
jgi:exopolysaccharide biosynthesis polyprenyl glycosylphosphotransferase